MAPKNKARQQPGNMRSRQQAKLNSQKAQKAPIEPSTRVGPRRQLPPSTEGGKRVGNSSQPWGQQQQTGDGVRRVRVNTNRPQLPPAETKQLPAAKTVPENRRLPGMQGPQQASRPQRPGTSRGPAMDRRAAAEAKAAEAAKGTNSTNVRVGQAGKNPALRGAFGKLNAAALALGIANAVDDARLTPRQQAEKYKVVNPNRGQDLLTKFEQGKLGTKDKETDGRPKALPQMTAAQNKKAVRLGQAMPSDVGNKFTGSTNRKPVDKKPAGVQPAAQQPTTVYQSNTPSLRPAPQPQRKPVAEAPKQSSNMDENYAAWAKANKGLAEKVKAGQSGYDAIQKALGKTPAANDQLKVNPSSPKTDSSTAANSSMDKNKTSIEGDKKAVAFTQKMTAEERRKRERMAQARLNGNA